MALIECVPNVSEGRRRDVIDRLASSIECVAGVRLLDRSSDLTHNRSVFTFAGDAQALRNAARRNRSAIALGRTSAAGRC